MGLLYTSIDNSTHPLNSWKLVEKQKKAKMTNKTTKSISFIAEKVLLQVLILCRTCVKTSLKAPGIYKGPLWEKCPTGSSQNCIMHNGKFSKVNTEISQA